MQLKIHFVPWYNIRTPRIKEIIMLYVQGQKNKLLFDLENDPGSIYLMSSYSVAM